MDSNGYDQAAQASENGTEEIQPLTPEDVSVIRARFGKKKKIVYYFMAIFPAAGALLSAYAVYDYGLSRLENFVPFIIGVVAILVCSLILVMFNQELNLELKNNRKWIYKGMVTGRHESSIRSGVAGDRDKYTDYYIRLGDVSFVHKDIYFEVGVGDRIDVQVSEKLNIVLSKNIIKNPAVAALTQQ